MSKTPTPTGHKRRNFYIDKDFQNKFIFRFCAIVGAGAVVTMVLLYILARHSTTVSIVKSRVVVMTTADFLVPLLLQTLVVVMLFVSMATAFMTLFVSHKIAGPLFRFKQTFRELASGNFTNQVRLRKDDQLQEVAGDFNQMITAVRTQIHAANENLAAVKKDVDSIGEFSVDDHKRKQFMDLKHKLGEVQKALDFFKT